MKRFRLRLPVRISLHALLAVLVWRALAQPSLPTPAGRAEALGDLSRLPPLQRAAFEPDPAFFDPIRTPGPIDWLTSHPEPGQSFADYTRILGTVRPKPQQKTLCILPVGSFGADAPALDVLRDCCAAYFGMPTRVLDAVPLENVPAKRRINPGTKKRQLLSTDLLTWLPSRKPADAYALIAVTMEDLYPQESWNFVFGQALLQGGAGVFSFARYDPAFYGDARDTTTRLLVLTRACKVLAHEMGHMFGLRHCIYYQCLMNGSNHLEETDRQPMHLCPVCLRKLHACTGLDLLARETALQTFYQSHGLTSEAGWSCRHLACCRTCWWRSLRSGATGGACDSHKTRFGKRTTNTSASSNGRACRSCTSSSTRPHRRKAACTRPPRRNSAASSKARNSSPCPRPRRRCRRSPPRRGQRILKLELGTWNELTITSAPL